MNNRGFTLIELTISMGIAALILIISGSVFFATQRQYDGLIAAYT